MEDEDEGYCLRCGDYIVVHEDEDGMWIECSCDAGYVD